MRKSILTFLTILLIPALVFAGSSAYSPTLPLPVGYGGTGQSTATGTGLPVLQDSPTLTTPNIGAATGTSVSVTGDVSGATIRGYTINQNVSSDASPTFALVSANGFKFPATQVDSGDANTLDDYVEYTSADASCTGAITASAIWKVVKIGRVVTLTLPATTGMASAAAGFTYGVALPAAYRPTAQVGYQSANIMDNSVTLSYPGLIIIAANGNITVYRNGDTSTNFSAAVGGLGNGTSVSWVK